MTDKNAPEQSSSSSTPSPSDLEADLSPDLRPTDLVTAWKVNELVVKFLRTRYMVFFWGAMILAPVVGVIGGAFIESQLFSGSMDRMLDDAKTSLSSQVDQAKSEVTKSVSYAKTSIADQVDVAKKDIAGSVTDAKDSIDQAKTDARLAAAEAKKEISENTKEASQYLTEIRSTRAALEYVMRGTKTGELAMVHERSTKLEEALRGFEGKLDKLESDLVSEYPDGVEDLLKVADDTRKLKEAVENIQLVLDEGGPAGALAGAFFKIYEFLCTVEVQLYTPRSTPADHLETLAAECSQISAKVSFSKDGKNELTQIIDWPSVSPEISFAPRSVEGELVDEALSVPDELEGLGRPSERVLRLGFDFPDNPQWWKIAGTDTSQVKRIDLRDFADFNTIRIELSFPPALEETRKKFMACTLSGVVPPRLIDITANVNRVQMPLAHDNVKGEEVYTGSIDGKPAVAEIAGVAKTETTEEVKAVPAQLGTIVLTFRKTTVFASAKEAYIKGLNMK
ncbi:hypothetical protein [Planctomycetes bacterium K23_9]|uniref:Uncharacterized protein n=1 Tax=Stieleria marina TaxID=1930275 RepID=A0A517NUI2_9BACT|nr:hypothetical protein K239x_27720 [Planctomycetes bacterium K23_9]